MSALGDTLRAAADHIERVGKAEGVYVDHGPAFIEAPVKERPCCALGAIGVVTGYIVDVDPKDAPYLDFLMLAEQRQPFMDAAQALALAVPTMDGEGGATVGDIMHWNDSMAPTATDIATTMRTAALVQDKKENRA